MKVWILALFNGIIIVQSQGYRKGDKKSYRWQVTPFQPCRDKLACDLEYRRYCPGDPSGRKCGSEIKQTLYYKSLSGCTADPKTCKKWNTISATKCNGTQCDRVTTKTCNEWPSCTLIYHYTCNLNGYIECTGEWNDWRVPTECHALHNASDRVHTQLVRTCYQGGKESILCGGNIQNSTTQKKYYPTNILSTLPQLPCITTKTTTTQTPLKSNLVIPIVLAIVFLVFLVVIGIILKRRCKKKKEDVSTTTISMKQDSKTSSKSTKQRHRFTEQFNEPALCQPNTSLLSNEQQSVYHVYEELSNNVDYEFATDPIESQEMLQTSKTSTTNNPFSAASSNVRYENPTQDNLYETLPEESTRQANEDEDGYLVPSMMIGSLNGEKCTNRNSYMELECKPDETNKLFV